MIKKSLWHGGLFVAAIALIAGVVGLQATQNRQAQAQSADCGTAVSFSEPQAGAVVSGVITLRVYVSPATGGTLSYVQEVEFEAGNVFISDGDEAPSSIWGTQWDTATVPNGERHIRAKIFGSNGNLICVTQPRMVLVQNTQPPIDEADNVEFRLVRKTPLTQPWVGVTNVSKAFRVEARLYSADNTYVVVDKQTDYNWRYDGPAKGSLSTNTSGPAINFWTGATTGETKFIVTGQFQDQTDEVRFKVQINSSATGTSYPENPDLNEDDFEAIDPDELSDADDVEKTDNGDIVPVRPTLQERVSSDPELSDCLIDIVGQTRYTEIIDGGSRLTFRELASAERCFASSRFVIPANVAPIGPEKVRELREDNSRVSIRSIEQAFENDEDQGFVMTGSAASGSTVLIYVFSEPLVLTTTTDENGNWTYVLEDPLEPGDHEVFVAVEDESGEAVRSGSFGFSVAQPASISTNPSGLSLTLDLSDPQQNATIYYVSGVVAVMLVGLGLYIFTVRRQHVLEAIDVVGEAKAVKK